ncbi:MAG: hypothetical protein ABH824_01840 [Nanoarchaeota archaeon]
MIFRLNLNLFLFRPSFKNKEAVSILPPPKPFDLYINKGPSIIKPVKIDKIEKKSQSKIPKKVNNKKKDTEKVIVNGDEKQKIDGGLLKIGQAISNEDNDLEKIKKRFTKIEEEEGEVEKKLDEEEKIIDSILSQNLFRRWLRARKEKKEKKATESEINTAIKIIKKQKVLPPLPKIEQFKEKEPATIVEEKPEMFLNSIDEIKKKMSDARSALVDLNLKESKKIYIEIIKLYDALSSSDKKLVYQDIFDLYDNRKNAERLGR